MNTWAKWVYSHKKLAVRIFSISYLQKWAGEIAPILVNLLGACCVACYKNHMPMLAPVTSHSLTMGHAVASYFAAFMKKSHIHIVKVMSLVALN